MAKKTTTKTRAITNTELRHGLSKPLVDERTQRLVQRGYKPMFGLSIEEVADVCMAAQCTWDYIGGDCLRAMECGEKAVLPRSHVIELVIDANRLEDTLRQDKKPELSKKFAALAYEQKQKVLKLTFTCSRYGW